MSEASSAERHMLARLTAETPSRRIIELDGTSWGRLILPAPQDEARARREGLKVMVIGSWTLGLMAFDALASACTGNVKCDAFRRLLSQWAPEAIVVAGFGQIIDRPVIEFPRYGFYNVHPSDLVGGHGAGPQPWEDAVARGRMLALDEDEGELTM